jgi:hypothetical protein
MEIINKLMKLYAPKRYILLEIENESYITETVERKFDGDQHQIENC